MDWAARLLLARLHYIDREGTTAAIQLYYSSAASKSALLAALEAETAFQAISDCTLYAISLSCSAVAMDSSTPTALGLDYGVLSFNTDSETGVIVAIPGLREDYYIQTGCFTGRQIDVTNADIIAFAAVVIENGVCSPDEFAATELCTGHRAQIWNALSRASG